MTTLTRISRKWSLFQIEKNLSNHLNSQSSAHHTVWLPRRGLDSVVFRPTWLFAYFSTLAREHDLSVVDWIKASSANDTYNRFLGTIEGISAIHSATRVENAQHELIKIEEDRVRSRLTEAPTIEASRSKTRASIVAWDPFKSIATAFIHISTGNDAVEYKEWSDAFLKIVGDLLPRHLVSRAGYPSEIPTNIAAEHAHSAEFNLRRLVYELYKNTIVHGCKQHLEGKQDSVITGPRYISVAKFKYVNSQELKHRIQGFPELETYFSRYKVNTLFAEISIGDVGMGVIGRFTSKRPNPSPKYPREEIDLLNRIISENLSSNLSDPTAGLGLQRSLNAIRILKAFLTVRTNRVWAHYSPQVSPNALELRSVKAKSELVNVTGTHFGILVPLAS